MYCKLDNEPKLNRKINLPAGVFETVNDVTLDFAGPPVICSLRYLSISFSRCFKTSTRITSASRMHFCRLLCARVYRFTHSPLDRDIGEVSAGKEVDSCLKFVMLAPESARLVSGVETVWCSYMVILIPGTRQSEFS